MNKAIIVGRLGNNPDVKQTQSGVTVANLSVATNERMKNKETGDYEDRTEWHRVTLFSRTAEVAQQYLVKGSGVAIEGKIQTRKYTDSEGIERYSTSIIGDKLEMTDRKTDAAQHQSVEQGFHSTEIVNLPHRQPAQQHNAAQEFDNDIPF
jgi:single-strand DNA-binding protein